MSKAALRWWVMLCNLQNYLGTTMIQNAPINTKPVFKKKTGRIKCCFQQFLLIVYIGYLCMALWTYDCDPTGFESSQVFNEPQTLHACVCFPSKTPYAHIESWGSQKASSPKAAHDPSQNRLLWRHHLGAKRKGNQTKTRVRWQFLPLLRFDKHLWFDDFCPMENPVFQFSIVVEIWSAAPKSGKVCLPHFKARPAQS